MSVSCRIRYVLGEIRREPPYKTAAGVDCNHEDARQEEQIEAHQGSSTA